jgi:hypothetical protein
MNVLDKVLTAQTVSCTDRNWVFRVWYVLLKFRNVTDSK